MVLHMYHDIAIHYHVSALSADNLFTAIWKCSKGDTPGLTSPCLTKHLDSSRWPNHTPRSDGPGRKLAVGPRSVVYGPGSGLRQLHSPSPKSYVNVSGRFVLRPISVRDRFEKRRVRPIRNPDADVGAGREAWLWNLGCRRGGSIRRRRRLVGRLCVCPLLNSTNGPGKDCRYGTGCQTRSTRFGIAGMKRNIFHLNQIAGVVWRKKVGRRSHFVPTVCERKKYWDIKNTKHHALRGNTHLKYILRNIKRVYRGNQRKSAVKRLSGVCFRITDTHFPFNTHLVSIRFSSVCVYNSSDGEEDIWSAL